MTVSEVPGSSGAELPIHLTRFIGRERELDELARLVSDTRLLTLTGAGGSGKTRLAREAALHSSASFARLGWVDLAPIANGELVAQQIATALHIHDRPSVTPLNLLIEALHAERALIVLDNCEHVVEACAPVAEALLRGCPRLTILATSREALGVSSETAWLVPPLATTEAIQLFSERARLALPSFALTDANSSSVSEICRRLDGIPLAIELAAARVRVLSPEQIARRLDDAFHLLAGGSRTALPRHRTLRATMEWSFGLLGAREQVLLRRLSIFAGTFTLDAAESVCVGDPLGVDDILDGVTALVDKSLIVMTAGEGVARYRLLETVRQYGVERLDEVGERAEVTLRFANQCIATVESIAPMIVGGAAKRGLIDRLRAEHDNIRAAVAWTSADRAHADLALRFIGGLGWFWYALGQFREARQFADRALLLETPDMDLLVRGRARLASALTAFFQGDSERAFADFQVALALLRATTDAISLGTALSKYGGARLLAGEVDAAIPILDEAMAFIRDTPPNDITRIFAEFWRGLAAYMQGDLDMSHHLVNKVLATGRAYELPTTTGHALSMCAQIALARGKVDDACTFASEALAIEVSSADDWGIAIALDIITRITARRGHQASAVRLIGALDSHRKRIAVGLPGLAPRESEALVASLRATSGIDFNALYAEGYAWTSEQTVRVATAEVSQSGAPRSVPPAPERGAASGQVTNGSGLRVRALGPLQVTIGDREVHSSAWGSARSRELLVYLLMHPEGSTKEQVGLALWPEASAAQLRNSFHVTLHRLRKTLAATDRVTNVGDRYRVDLNGVDFDASEFERDATEALRALKRGATDALQKLEHALDRYRGDLLDGEPVGDWYLEHRERLQRLYVDGLMQLGAQLVAGERHVKAAEAYRRVLLRDELHEDALVALMRCHAALGERPQALRVYRRFVDRLKEELDAEPGDDVVELAEQLQQGSETTHR